MKFCETLKEKITAWYLKFKKNYYTSVKPYCFTRWSRSTSNFYALIGQNFTGELMRKIYAASRILFTLTAEADRVLCQLVMFLTVFFHWDVQSEIQLLYIRSLLLFMGSLFIGFLVEKYVICQSRKSDFRWHHFRFAPCLMRKRVAKSEAILAFLDTFQGCISKPE